VKALRFEYVGLPESVNHLYLVKGGRKILTTQGRKYKNDFILRGGGVPPADLMAFNPQQNEPYELNLFFYMLEETVLNLTYGVDKRVKSPFADIDTTNLIKLAEDCIATVVGIRDRNNFDVHAHKRITLGEERLVAWLRPLEGVIIESDEDGW